MQNNLDQTQKIPVKIDNSETLQVLEKLENLEDQDLAIRYLKMLNETLRILQVAAVFIVVDYLISNVTEVKVLTYLLVL